MSVTMGNVIASPQHADARAAIMRPQMQNRLQAKGGGVTVVQMGCLLQDRDGGEMY